MGRREVHSLTSSDLDISGQQDSQNDYCLSVGGSQSNCITPMANKLPKASLTAEKQFAVKYPDLDTQNPSQGKEQKDSARSESRDCLRLWIGTSASAVLGPSLAGGWMKQATAERAGT